MKDIKIIIVDDHSIFRNGLKLLMKQIDGVKVIGEAENGDKLMSLLESAPPDIIFMDINMPVVNGIDATQNVLKEYPGIKIIALTTFDDDESFNNMLYAGVEGYMLKNSEIHQFKDAIEKVSEGHNYFSEEILAKLTRSVFTRKFEKQKEKISLTKRETEVLELICKGYSNKKIGETLNISDRTVERYKTILMEKTQTQNTLNLVIFAFKNEHVNL